MEKEEYIEKYNQWNIKKQDIQFSERSEEDEIYFKEGDIWWSAIGINVGDESLGKGEVFRRPVLVFKKLSSNLCIALPMTSKPKFGTWFFNIMFDNERVCVLLYQIRILDKKRFQLKIGELDISTFKQIKEKLKTLLELS